MLLAVTPLPNPESTPPVTTTYFISSTGFESLAHPLSTLARKFLFRPSLISSIVRITVTHVGRTRRQDPCYRGSGTDRY